MKTNYPPKPLFLERMKQLLPNKSDYQSYLEILKTPPIKSIRCNTLKISVKKLKKKLEDKGWKINQPWKNYPEVMIVENELQPGEIGRALEHLLGYYYVQELASMLPIIALRPEQNEIILDLCSSPGSKTTQMASEMNNKGTIIANEVSLGRLKILASNLERCGATNTIITRKEGISFCKKLKKEGISREQYLKGRVDKGNQGFPLLFDRILVDAPCSGEGTLRSTPKTYLMWNINTIKNLSKLQKNLVSSALEILKPNGELIYSTCTHAPEENEEVVDYILKEFPNLKIQEISLPIKYREGITQWKNKTYSDEVKKCARIYPQDNNTEGFFIAKFKKLK